MKQPCQITRFAHIPTYIMVPLLAFAVLGLLNILYLQDCSIPAVKQPQNQAQRTAPVALCNAGQGLSTICRKFLHIVESSLPEYETGEARIATGTNARRIDPSIRIYGYIILLAARSWPELARVAHDGGTNLRPPPAADHGLLLFDPASTDPVHTVAAP